MKTARILVVDDESNIRVLLEEILSEGVCKVDGGCGFKHIKRGQTEPDPNFKPGVPAAPAPKKRPKSKGKGKGQVSAAWSSWRPGNFTGPTPAQWRAWMPKGSMKP